MLDAAFAVGGGFLDDLPSDAFVLGVLCTALERLDGVVQGVNDVFGSAFGGVAVFPWVALVECREEAVEGFGGGGWGDCGRDREGSVEGEEGGEAEVLENVLARAWPSVCVVYSTFLGQML